MLPTSTHSSYGLEMDVHRTVQPFPSDGRQGESALQPHSAVPATVMLMSSRVALTRSREPARSPKTPDPVRPSSRRIQLRSQPFGRDSQQVSPPVPAAMNAGERPRARPTR